jgi:hypothetical protein
MPTSKEKRHDLEVAQAELNNFEQRFHLATDGINKLQAERKETTKLLVSADNLNTSAINGRLDEIDRKVKLYSDRIGGLTGNIEDSKKKIEEAEAALREATEHEQQECERYCEMKEAEKVTIIRSFLARQSEQIKELYKHLCIELADFNVNCDRCGIGEGDILRAGFVYRVLDAIKQEGYRKCFQQGFNALSSWPIHAITNAEGIAVNLVDLMKQAREQDRAIWQEAWRREKGL